MRRKILGIITLSIIIGSASVVTAAAGGWNSDGKGTWYQYDNGSYPVDKAVSFKTADGKSVVYVFNAEGYQVKDAWYQTSDGKWYLLRPDGSAVRTYATSGGKWWVFSNETGSMYGKYQSRVSEGLWENDNPGTYYNIDTKQNESFADGVKISGQDYTFNSDGSIKTGFRHQASGVAAQNHSTGQQTSSGSSQESVTILNSDQIFAVADQYVPSYLTNVRRADAIPLLSVGYYAYYYCDQGVYRIYLERDLYGALLFGTGGVNDLVYAGGEFVSSVYQ